MVSHLIDIYFESAAKVFFFYTAVIAATRAAN